MFLVVKKKNFPIMVIPYLDMQFFSHITKYWKNHAIPETHLSRSLAALGVNLFSEMFHQQCLKSS